MKLFLCNSSYYDHELLYFFLRHIVIFVMYSKYDFNKLNNCSFWNTMSISIPEYLQLYIMLRFFLNLPIRDLDLATFILTTLLLLVGNLHCKFPTRSDSNVWFSFPFTHFLKPHQGSWLRSLGPPGSHDVSKSFLQLPPFDLLMR